MTTLRPGIVFLLGVALVIASVWRLERARGGVDSTRRNGDSSALAQ